MKRSGRVGGNAHSRYRRHPRGVGCVTVHRRAAIGKMQGESVSCLRSHVAGGRGEQREATAIEVMSGGLERIGGEALQLL